MPKRALSFLFSTAGGNAAILCQDHKGAINQHVFLTKGIKHNIVRSGTTPWLKKENCVCFPETIFNWLHLWRGCKMLVHYKNQLSGFYFEHKQLNPKTDLKLQNERLRKVQPGDNRPSYLLFMRDSCTSGPRSYQFSMGLESGQAAPEISSGPSPGRKQAQHLGNMFSKRIEH